MNDDDHLLATRLGVMSALQDGDAGAAYRMVLRLMDEGWSMPMIIDEVLAPIQVESGRRWEAGDVTISEEHVATAAVETLVAMLAGLFDQPHDAEIVVVVCAEGDTHSLPPRMASALLSYEGFRTLFLGGSVPASDLAEYLRSLDADVLVVSCTRSAHLLGARACVAAGHRAGVPVVVGGRAFGDARRWEQIGADAYAPRLSALAEILQTWTPDPEQAEGQVMARHPGVDTIESNRTLIAEMTTAALLAEADPSDRSRRVLVGATEELVDVLAVSLHFDDADLLVDQTRVLSAHMQSTGCAVTADVLLASLADAAAPLTPGIAEIVAAARQLGR